MLCFLTVADVFEDFLSPVIAAQTLFYSCASKRKEVLQKSMGFCMQLLTSGTAETRQKDGAMHMIGAVAEVLLKVSCQSQSNQLSGEVIYHVTKLHVVLL